MIVSPEPTKEKREEHFPLKFERGIFLPSFQELSNKDILN